MRLILASASPRRAEILRNAGFVFDVVPADVDETMLPGEAPEDYVQRLALAKARVAAKQVQVGTGAAIIIGADTAIAMEGQALGKPSGAEDVRRMLGLLSGKTHEVLTGLSVLSVPDGREARHVERTRVTFVQLRDEDIEGYLATGEPLDKAGAYAIQGIGGKFVSRIEGCYFNVIGLPLSRLWRMLRTLGWKDSRSI